MTQIATSWDGTAIRLDIFDTPPPLGPRPRIYEDGVQIDIGEGALNPSELRQLAQKRSQERFVMTYGESPMLGTGGPLVWRTYP